SPTLGLALTQDGDLVRFNPTAGTSAVVFVPDAGQQINTFAVAAGAGLVFTANGDGSVSLLSSDGDQYVETLNSVSGLDNPSALEVLERADGVFELYLTEAGESRPVLLTLELRSELGSVAAGNNFNPVVVLLTEVAAPAAPTVEHASDAARLPQ